MATLPPLPPKLPSKLLKKRKKIKPELLEIALRSCNIQLSPVILTRVVDIVNLLNKKGNKTSISDIENLKAKWITDQTNYQKK